MFKPGEGMVYCPRCGKETEQSGKFCQWCGAELREVQDRKEVMERPFPRRKIGTIKTENFAGLGWRFLGGIIDLIFLVLFDFLAAAVIGIITWLMVRPNPVTESVRFINQYYRHLPRTDASGQVVSALIPPQILFCALIFFVFVPWIYFAYFYSSANQGTLGNMASRVAITDMQGNRITFGRGTLRFFAMYLCLATILIGFLIIAFTKYKQGLHDKIAATLAFRQ